MNDLENPEEDYKRFVLENKNIIINVKNIPSKEALDSSLDRTTEEEANKNQVR